MESVLNFLADNYVYFMIGSAILLFALIGFAVDGKKKKKEESEPFNPMGNTNQMPNNMVNQNVQGVPNGTPNSTPLTTGFSGFVTENQNPAGVETPVQPQVQEEPSLDNLNATPQAPEEALTFGPINANNEESIFTEPPVVENNPNTAPLNNEVPPTSEPVMESLDFGTQEAPAAEMPVSMEPEQPVMQTPEVPPVPSGSAPAQTQNVVEPPMFNNTIGQ